MGRCAMAPSPWVIPLYMVQKTDMIWRHCGDYRRLNLITEPDQYAMPNITDLTNSINKARTFSKLDMLKGNFMSRSTRRTYTKRLRTTPKEGLNISSGEKKKKNYFI